MVFGYVVGDGYPVHADTVMSGYRRKGLSGFYLVVNEATARWN